MARPIPLEIYKGGITNWRLFVVHHAAKLVGLCVKYQGYPLGGSSHRGRTQARLSMSKWHLQIALLEAKAAVRVLFGRHPWDQGNSRPAPSHDPRPRINSVGI